MLVSNQQNIALGRVKVGEARKMKYTINNTGSSLIKIEGIHLGCGRCTTASMDANQLQAGESSTLNVVFTPDSTGGQVKNVTVKYTGGTLTVKFSAEVI